MRLSLLRRLIWSAPAATLAAARMLWPVWTATFALPCLARWPQLVALPDVGVDTAARPLVIDNAPSGLLAW